MAYKLVNETQLDYDIKRLADAIRNKNGTSGNLTFPDGMAETIRGWTIQNSYYDSSYSPILSPDPANYILVAGDDLDNKITTVCDAFREIYGSSSMKIQFPDELIRRIECLDIVRPTIYPGRYYITGTYMGDNWGGFEQYLSGYITMRESSSGSSGTTYYEGPFDKLVLSDDTMTLDVYYQGSCVQAAYQSSWWWGSDGILVTISETQNVSGKFKTWWDSHTSAAPDEQPDITFYYQGTAYTVAANTTWYDFVSYNCPISTLTIRMPENTYYIYDMQYDSYVGDYETDRAVEGGDYIVENRSYYYGFEPANDNDNGISFTADSAQYTVAEGTTIQQWLDSGDAPGYYTSLNGYLYNSSASYYVAEDDDLSNGTYEAASVNKVIYSGDVYISYDLVQPPATTITFYLNGSAYECKEGQTWRQMISEYGDYSNMWGHVEINSDGRIKMEGSSSNDYIISSDNLNNHCMYLEHADNVIGSAANYNWVTAIKLNSSDVYEAYNMQYTSTVEETWYVPYADISVYYSEPGANQSPQWAGLSSPYIYMKTSGTLRPHRDNDYGYDMTPRSDYGVTIYASNMPHTFWFRANGQYYTTSDNTVYPAGKIKCSGYFPVAFTDWLNNNFQKE